MEITLKNFDSAFLPVLESFKSVMPALTIEKKREWKDKRAPEQVRAELKEALEDYEKGDTSKFCSFEEAKARSEATIKRLG